MWDITDTKPKIDKEALVMDLENKTYEELNNQEKGITHSIKIDLFQIANIQKDIDLKENIHKQIIIAREAMKLLGG